MSPEQVPPPPAEEQASSTTLPTTPEISSEQTDAVPAAPERPHVPFSYASWASSGIARILYRGWTRVATRLFPENSAGEHLARMLHIPLPDALNMSWVNEHLAVGGRIRPEDIKAVALSGITHVVDTRSEYSDDKDALAKEHIDMLYLPTPDTYPLSVEQLMQGSEWTDKYIREGGRVLIHCEHGVGRSVLLTCAVLVYEGMHARDALELVKQKRWQASPNQRQVNRLREFEAVLASRPRPNA
ncbi:MAG TPA: dual specificity protein phosphatase [Ktedonobacteraceae bacterium]